MRYRKKPVEIEAVQWTGENLEEIEEFAQGGRISSQRTGEYSYQYARRPHEGQ